jgi:hypothetical protein
MLRKYATGTESCNGTAKRRYDLDLIMARLNRSFAGKRRRFFSDVGSQNFYGNGNGSLNPGLDETAQ